MDFVTGLLPSLHRGILECRRLYGTAPFQVLESLLLRSRVHVDDILAGETA
jgi:hypothetical protein